MQSRWAFTVGWALVLACGLGWLAPSAHAQPPSAQPAAVEKANALFVEGKELLEAGQVAQACERFQASFVLVRGIGVQYNFARCYGTLGRTASALRHFLEVADVAERTGQPKRAAVARERAQELAPRLIRLRITVDGPISGLMVSVDDTPLAQSERDSLIPVDPGRHEVSAFAPEHTSWTTTIDAREEGSIIDVQIPALAARKSPPESDEEPSELDALVVAGIGVGALGVVGLIAAAATAGVAASRDADADAFCDPTGCTQAGVDLGDEATAFAEVATGLLIGGGVVTAAGIAMVVIAFQAPATAFRVQPVIGGELVGVVIVGHFR